MACPHFEQYLDNVSKLGDSYVACHLESAPNLRLEIKQIGVELVNHPTDHRSTLHSISKSGKPPHVDISTQLPINVKKGYCKVMSEVFTIGKADDQNAADGDKILSYPQAIKTAEEWLKRIKPKELLFGSVKLATQ
jgi:hypothetical protein